MAALNKIKAFKVLKTSGAYWRGDSTRDANTHLCHLFPRDKKRLKEYLQFIEEAKKRDHKIIGPALDLFSFKEEAPGMPFIHPEVLSSGISSFAFLRELLIKQDYIEIKTPTMMSKELWETLGPLVPLQRKYVHLSN